MYLWKDYLANGGKVMRPHRGSSIYTRAGRHGGSFRHFVALATVLALILTSVLHAQSAPTEYQVKAAYLYSFAKFVEWPPGIMSSESSFNICVLGHDPFDPAFGTTIAGESIKGKNVAVKKISRAQEATGCQILFISSSEEARLKEILAVLVSTSVLTVSDMPYFTRRGGMIQFVTEAKRVRFEVNLTSAERTGLTLSSQLLKVAIGVRRG
jgi:hypothetical protein